MGDGTSPLTQQQMLQRQYIQRSLNVGATGAGGPGSPGGGAVDALDPESVSARQKAAIEMRNALNEDFGTSSRGIDAAPGSGLQGPPGDPLAGAPLIGTSGAVNTSVDQQAAQAAAMKVKNDAQAAALDAPASAAAAPASTIIDDGSGARRKNQR